MNHSKCELIRKSLIAAFILRNIGGLEVNDLDFLRNVMVIGIKNLGEELVVLRFLIRDSRFSKELCDQLYSELEQTLEYSNCNQQKQDIADLLLQDGSPDLHSISKKPTGFLFKVDEYSNQQLLRCLLQNIFQWRILYTL